MTYARYVGRVGGLAVALGIGFWIAGTSGVAYADSSASDSGSSPNPSSSPSAPSGAGRDTGHTNKDGDGAKPESVANKTSSTATDSQRLAKTPNTPAQEPPRGSPATPKSADEVDSPLGATTENTGGTSDPVTIDESPGPGDDDSSGTAKPDKSAVADKSGPRNRAATNSPRVTQVTRARESTATTSNSGVAVATDTATVSPTSLSSTTTSRMPEASSQRNAAASQTRPLANTSESAPAGIGLAPTPTSISSASLMASPRVDLGSTEVDTPTAPVPLEALWTTLAAVRREFDNFAAALVGWVDAGTAELAQTTAARAEVTTLAAASSAAVVNSAPIAGTPTFLTPNPVNGTVSGSLNFTDPDGNALTYVVSVAPAGGKVTLNTDGTFVYAPTQATRLLAGSTLAADADRFVVTASDGQATTAVTVNAPIHSAQLSTGSATQVGLSPAGVVTFGDRIYTANTLSNNITAIDAGTNSVIASIPVGQAPTQLALSPDGTVLYVTNSGSNTLSAISTVSGATLATLSVGLSPRGVAVNPTGNRIYVANSASNTVTVLNAANGSTVATVSVGVAPVGVVVSGDGTRAYVANRGSNTVSVINTATQSVMTTYAVGSMPQALALTATGKLYVTNSGSDNVTVVNTISGQRIATIAVRDQPFGITLSRDQSVAYVVNSDSSVSVISTKTSTKITGTLLIETATGSMVVLSPDGKKVYVTNTGGTTLRSASLIHVDPPPSNPGGATSAVTDNFTGSAGSAPNSSLWSYHLGAGGTTGELNAYTNWPRNASLDGNGNLVITAIEEPVTVPGYGTYDYSSAWLTTEDKLEFTYGTVAARIKLPAEQGIVPAFWMLGSDVETVGWPLGGEIDIIEQTDTGQFAGSTIHGPGGYVVSTAVPSGTSTDFHEYWVRWEPNKITTGIDDLTLGIYTPDSLPPGTPWTFNDRSMYAILSLAVGSPFGQPDETTDLPAQMVVDWVRYTPLS